MITLFEVNPFVETSMGNPQLNCLELLPWDEDEIRMWVDPVPGIYGLYCRRNMRFYIGKSNNLLSRVLGHYYSFIPSLKEKYPDKAHSSEFLDGNWNIMIFETYPEDQDNLERLLSHSEAYWSRLTRSKDYGWNESKDGSGYDSNSGRIWINNGKENKRVFLTEYTKDFPTWNRGFIGCKIGGKVNINKEGIDKRVERSQLQEYLEQGWVEGKEFISSRLSAGYYGYDPRRNKTRMNNGSEEIYITDTWYLYWKNKGFVSGRLKEPYLVVTKEMDQVPIYDFEIEQYLSEGYIKGYRSDYYDGKASIHFDPNHVPIDHDKTVWMTRLGIDSRVVETEIESREAEGWIRGRSLVAARTADGGYDPTRFNVLMNNGVEEIKVTHLWTPHWLSKGYKFGDLAGYKKYITNGVTEQIVSAENNLIPEGFVEQSLAEWWSSDIQEMYSRMKK